MIINNEIRQSGRVTLVGSDDLAIIARTSVVRVRVNLNVITWATDVGATHQVDLGTPQAARAVFLAVTTEVGDVVFRGKRDQHGVVQWERHDER